MPIFWIRLQSNIIWQTIHLTSAFSFQAIRSSMIEKYFLYAPSSWTFLVTMSCMTLYNFFSWKKATSGMINHQNTQESQGWSNASGHLPPCGGMHPFAHLPTSCSWKLKRGKWVCLETFLPMLSHVFDERTATVSRSSEHTTIQSAEWSNQMIGKQTAVNETRAPK